MFKGLSNILGQMYRDRRPMNTNIRRGAVSSLGRFYQWVIKGPVITLAGERQYIKTKRGPWVRKEHYDAVRDPKNAAVNLGCNTWIRED